MKSRQEDRPAVRKEELVDSSLKGPSGPSRLPNLKAGTHKNVRKKPPFMKAQSRNVF